MGIIAALAVAMLVMTGSAQAQAFADTDGLLIEYDHRSDGPVNTDSTPLLRVYGDGRLLVAKPWYRRDAGLYQGTLTQGELQALLANIQNSNVLDMNRETLVQLRQELSSQATLYYERSETETTRFSFALAGANTMTEFAWKNLRGNAENYGAEVAEYATLWRIDRLLHDLTEHPSLVQYADMAVSGRIQR